MRPLRLTLGILLVISGAVWALQGLDVAFAPQSAMTGDMIWVALGVVAVIGGGFLIWTGRRTRR
ncbi:MAG: hypothetical protein ACRDZM_00580 [Acidimicrobiia bacterium]